MVDSNEHQKHSPLKTPTSRESVPGINGLILTGGKSSRMGADKGSMDYHGVPQNDFLVRLLSPFVSEVYLSCHPDRVPETHHSILPDTFLDLGPYGGVLSAFRHDPNSAWLVIACDIPMLDEATLAHLIASRDHSKVATCFHDPSTDLPEPLITLWEPRAYSILLQNLSQGISCLRKVLINTDSNVIQIERPEVLRNANTPQEAKEMWEILVSRPEYIVKSIEDAG